MDNAIGLLSLLILLVLIGVVLPRFIGRTQRDAPPVHVPSDLPADQVLAEAVAYFSQYPEVTVTATGDRFVSYLAVRRLDWMVAGLLLLCGLIPGLLYLVLGGSRHSLTVTVDDGVRVAGSGWLGRDGRDWLTKFAEQHPVGAGA